MKNIFFDIFFSFIAGALGSMGFGGGIILIAYLTSIAGINQTKAQGINLIFFIPVAIISSLVYIKHKLVKWEIIKKILPTSILGSIIGSISLKFLTNTSTVILSKVFGLFLVLIGIFLIFRKNT